jgi:hypothetical protein
MFVSAGISSNLAVHNRNYYNHYFPIMLMMLLKKCCI